MKVLPIIILLTCTLQLQSQSWELVTSIKENGIKQVDIDGRGILYLSLSSGVIKKMNQKGEQISIFSPVKNGQISGIDASSQFKILLFYQNFQEVIILNRFLGDPARYSLKDFSIGYGVVVAYNFQRDLWAIDQTDFTLKLLRLETNELILDQPLYQYFDEVPNDISAMQEYQGRLYIVDEPTGVLVLDNFGNLIKKIQNSGIVDFAFDDNEMICLKDDQVVLYGLYNTKKSTIETPKNGYVGVRKRGEHFFFVDSDRLDIYKYISPVRAIKGNVDEY